MISSVPDKQIVRAYALFWVAIYLAIYFVFREVFPNKALIDTDLIRDIAEGRTYVESMGYNATAAVYSLLPFWLSNALTGLLNAAVIYAVLMNIGSFISMMIIPIVLYPMIMLDMQAPSKETLVIAIGFALFMFSQKAKSETTMFLAIACAYLIYGTFVRNYYLLIFAAFVAFRAMMATPLALRWLYGIAFVLLLILLPEEIFLALGSSRDKVNMRMYAWGTGSVRTYFMNPYPSDSALHFLGNYLHAFVMLNFPFVRFVTIKEFLLFANVLIYAFFMFYGIRNMRGAERLLPLLFAAHIAVQTIFEPDSGSYIRHFSSVLLYIMPAWRTFDKRRVVISINNE